MVDFMNIKHRIKRVESQIGMDPGPDGIDPKRFKTFVDFIVWETKCENGEINPTPEQIARVRELWVEFMSTPQRDRFGGQVRRRI